nr:hypothetical protein [uncultured Desulfobulbus sp.]
MPFVKISALPSNDFDIEEVTRAVETDLYIEKERKTADPSKPPVNKAVLPLGSTTIIWQTLNCITHTRAATKQQQCLRSFDPTQEEFPLFVDLYLTSKFDYDKISEIMKSITATLHEKTDIPEDYVFIHTHIRNPGHVYIMNKVWPCEITHAGK